MLVFLGLERRRWWIRWPVKLGLFGLVVFAVLYPYPSVLRRHVQHIRGHQQLTDPGDPAIAGVRREFDQFVADNQVSVDGPVALNKAVERFVYRRVPYAWDWDTWGVADYLPTPAEVVSQGREDCDGRAVVAAGLLRSFGVDARLVADPRHVWVRTPSGDLMNPLGPPAFQSGPGGLRIHWRALLNPGPLAYGVAVFPLVRELIILLAVWFLFLPAGMGLFRSALVLIVLFETLLVVRLAGANPVAPRYLLLALAAVQWPVLLWFVSRWRPRPSAAAESSQVELSR